MLHSPSVKLTAFAFPMGSFGSAHQTYWSLYSKYPGGQSRSASGSAAGGGGIPSSGSGSAGRHHKWGSGFRFGFKFGRPGAGSGVRMRSLSTILEYWRSYDVPRKTCIGCSWSLHAFSFGNLLQQWRPSPRRIIPTSFEHHESRVIN